MNIAFRKFYVKHKFFTLIFVPLALIVIILGLMFLSTYIPRTQSTDYQNEKVLSNRFIREKTYLGVNSYDFRVAPADTLSYFKAIFEKNNSYKVDLIELNLHITSDKKLVLFSGNTLDSVTNAKATYRENNVHPEDMTYEQLKKYNLGYNFKDENNNFPYRNNTFLDTKILSLEEALSYLETVSKDNWKTELLYIVNIKTRAKMREEAIDNLYEILIGNNTIGRTVINTPNSDTAAYIDGKYPTLKRSATNTEAVGFYLACVFGAKLSKITVNYSALLVPYRAFIVNLGKKSIIDYAHKYGISVMYKGINKTKDVEYLSKIGADLVISDNPLNSYHAINGTLTHFD